MNFKKAIMKQFNVDKHKVNKKNLRKLIKMNIQYKGYEYNKLPTEVRTKFEYLVNNLEDK